MECESYSLIEHTSSPTAGSCACTTWQAIVLELYASSSIALPHWRKNLACVPPIAPLRFTNKSEQTSSQTKPWDQQHPKCPLHCLRFLGASSNSRRISWTFSTTCSRTSR